MSRSRVEPGLIRWQNHPHGRSQGLHTLFQRHKLAMGGYYNIIKKSWSWEDIAILFNTSWSWEDITRLSNTSWPWVDITILSTTSWPWKILQNHQTQLVKQSQQWRDKQTIFAHQMKVGMSMWMWSVARKDDEFENFVFHSSSRYDLLSWIQLPRFSKPKLHLLSMRYRELKYILQNWLDLPIWIVCPPTTKAIQFVGECK